MMFESPLISRTAMMALSACALLTLAPAAHAVDGVIEINQASVDAAGGFPYTISASGSPTQTQPPLRSLRIASRSI
jgi:hypothetical protein